MADEGAGGGAAAAAAAAAATHGDQWTRRERPGSAHSTASSSSRHHHQASRPGHHSHHHHHHAAVPTAAHPTHAVASVHSGRRRVLVTGGSGFLGRHLIQTLLGLGHEIRCFDIVQTFFDARVTFFQGDLTANDQSLLAEACDGVDTVFHTASLTDPLAAFADVWAVNVLGTQQVVRACLGAGVRNLIFTSTTAVIFQGRDVEGATEEQCPYPRSYLDPYSRCKAEAEKIVVASNGLVSELTGQALCTVSLRPHAIFGPRDTHFISKLIARARNGLITHMIGNGENKVDFTYVGNCIHAMIITMHQLSAPDTPLDETLPPEYAAARARIGGQCYFITNGEPRPFWEFVNTILNETGCIGPTKKISFSIAYFIAFAMECLQWLVSRLPQFLRFRMDATLTRHMVCIMGRHQWYSCAKAARDLGYEPIISMDSGISTTINYFFRRKNVSLWQANASAHGHHPPSHGLAPLHGSAPKLLTRVVSEPTPPIGPAGDHPAHSRHHHPPASVGSSSSLPSPHRRLLERPGRHGHPHPTSALSNAGSPTQQPQWPQRHWSTSPPAISPDHRAHQRHATTNSTHTQHAYATTHAQPHSQQPASRSVYFHANGGGGAGGGAAYHGDPHLVAPRTLRPMPTVPSAAFLNAYAVTTPGPPQLTSQHSPPSHAPIAHHATVHR